MPACPPEYPDEDPAPPLVAVISHVLWDRYFGGAPDVVGKTLKVNAIPVTIVGVAPRRFAGARTGGSQVRVWLPLSARRLLQPATASDLTSYDAAVFGLVARLLPGSTSVRHCQRFRRLPRAPSGRPRA